MKSEKLTSNWYNKTGEECLKYYSNSQKNEIEQLKSMLEKIPKRAHILDAGCGIGIPVTKFLTKRNYTVIGIDISNKMIKKAKENAPRAKFKVMSLYDINFPQKKFDAIVSFFTILHLEKTRLLKVFKKFHSILKHKGYLLFSINKGKKEGYFKFFGENVYFSEFTKKEIKEILRESNFKIISEKDLPFGITDKKEHHMYFLVQKL